MRQDVPLASIFKTFISEDSLKITEGGQPLPVCIFGGTTEKSLIIYMRLLWVWHKDAQVRRDAFLSGLTSLHLRGGMGSVLISAAMENSIVRTWPCALQVLFHRPDPVRPEFTFGRLSDFHVWKFRKRLVEHFSKKGVLVTLLGYYSWVLIILVWKKIFFSFYISFNLEIWNLKMLYYIFIQKAFCWLSDSGNTFKKEIAPWGSSVAYWAVSFSPEVSEVSWWLLRHWEVVGSDDVILLFGLVTFLCICRSLVTQSCPTLLRPHEL